MIHFGSEGKLQYNRWFYAFEQYCMPTPIYFKIAPRCVVTDTSCLLLPHNMKIRHLQPLLLSAVYLQRHIWWPNTFLTLKRTLCKSNGLYHGMRRELAEKENLKKSTHAVLKNRSMTNVLLSLLAWSQAGCTKRGTVDARIEHNFPVQKLFAFSNLKE